MPKAIKKLGGFIKAETAQSIALLVVSCLIIWAVGCESKVPGLVNPQRKVTRDQLTAQVESFAAHAEAAYNALDRQDEFRRVVFEKLALFAQSGSLNSAGVIAAVFSVFGIAAVTDNVKKRAEIKKLKGEE